MTPSRPNILLIVTDEERERIPRPAGFSLPARERLAERGVRFDNYYVASAMCSSSRSVLYTGQHVVHTEIYDNDNMPYVRPLDPALGTIGTMLGAQGYYCTYQGKWHLSNAYLDPANPRSTDRRPRALRLLRVERLGRHRRRRVGRAARRPGHCRASGEVAPRAGRCRGRRAAVVHGGQLRQPARHHELRLRRAF